MGALGMGAGRSAAKEEREALFRRFLVYSGLVVAFGPLLAWLLFVVPGWM